VCDNDIPKTILMRRTNVRRQISMLFKYLKRHWGSSLILNPIKILALPQVSQHACLWRAKAIKPSDMAEPDAKGRTQYEPCYYMD